MRDGAIEAAEMQLNAPVSSSTPGSSGKPSCDNTAPEEIHSFDVNTVEKVSQTNIHFMLDHACKRCCG